MKFLTSVVVVSLCLVVIQGQELDTFKETCEGICGRKYIAVAPCQCDAQCPFFDNCCKDHTELCNNTYTCPLKCRSKLPNKYECQLCSFHSESCVTDEEILEFTKSLWNLNSYVPEKDDFVINKTGGRIFAYVKEEITRQEAFVRASSLFDKYDRDWAVRETNKRKSRRLEIRFIDHFLRSKIGNAVYKFLRKKGLSGCGFKWEFKNILKVIWTSRYKRLKSFEMGSSGFENVFVGETLDGMGIGLNHWMRLYQLEKAGEITLRPLNETEKHPGFLHLKYDWGGNTGVTTIFIGVTPQWEFGIYTLCHILRPDRSCSIMAKSWDGNYFKVTMRSEFKYKPNSFGGLELISNVQVFNDIIADNGQ